MVKWSTGIFPAIPIDPIVRLIRLTFILIGDSIGHPVDPIDPIDLIDLVDPIDLIDPVDQIDLIY